MKRTTIFIDESLERDLQALARHQQVPVSKLMRDSFARYLADHRPQGLALRFLGRGRSGQKHTADRHEEVLWHDLDPHGVEVPARRRRRR